MSRKYKSGNNDKIYFVSFAVTNWIDLFIRNEYREENLKIAIESSGGSLEDVVMLRIYKVNYQNADGQIISDVLRSYFGTQCPPSSTWINVNGLANEEFMIEIEAQAVL